MTGWELEEEESPQTGAHVWPQLQLEEEPQEDWQVLWQVEQAFCCCWALTTITCWELEDPPQTGAQV